MGNWCISRGYQTTPELQQIVNSSTRPSFFCVEGTYRGVVTKCYDGDTCWCVFKYHDKFYTFKCRLFGIDTPELQPKHKDKSKNEKEKKLANKAKTSLQQLVLHEEVTVICHTPTKPEKYGRLLVTLKKGNLDVNKYMIKKGYAKEYFGTTKPSHV